MTPRLDAWDVGRPPSRLVDGVMRDVSRHERRKRARRALAAGAMVAVACAASAVVAVTHGRVADRVGDVVAGERMEIEIAPGVLAVMEQAAHLAWRGRELLQDRGEVSYRVATGAALQLSTPTGKLTAAASSTRVRVEASSTYVIVHSGEVAVSAAGQRVALGAGRYARASLASLTVDRDDVDGSIGRVLGVAARQTPVNPPDPVGSATVAPAPRLATRSARVTAPSVSASSAPTPSAPPPPRRAPIVPPCFCSPMQAVCDCGG